MALYMYVFVDDYQKDYCSGTDKKVKSLKRFDILTAKHNKEVFGNISKKPYYMAESVFAMRLLNLRSVTCYTNQNF